jgi:hypothetical protein
MNKIIKEALENGISFNIGYNNVAKRIEYTADGFYKSETIKLVENENGTLLAIARYDERQ